eukprot:TRINITY_DN14579_c0_g2_i1.p1 TRINITY_DN14579_c0_g2~~TRINITY_DN14579_c0_g2_i1.p1  ORF type:complete len:196 (+),score=18.98 TRINITY_DN14579_c0_g2_i1:679-1266(+)
MDWNIYHRVQATMKKSPSNPQVVGEDKTPKEAPQTSHAEVNVSFLRIDEDANVSVVPRGRVKVYCTFVRRNLLVKLDIPCEQTSLDLNDTSPSNLFHMYACPCCRANMMQSEEAGTTVHRLGEYFIRYTLRHSEKPCLCCRANRTQIGLIDCLEEEMSCHKSLKTPLNFATKLSACKLSSCALGRSLSWQPPFST